MFCILRRRMNEIISSIYFGDAPVPLDIDSRQALAIAAQFVPGEGTLKAAHFFSALAQLHPELTEGRSLKLKAQKYPAANMSLRVAPEVKDALRLAEKPLPPYIPASPEVIMAALICLDAELRDEINRQLGVEKSDSFHKDSLAHFFDKSNMSVFNRFKDQYSNDRRV